MNEKLKTMFVVNPVSAHGRTKKRWLALEENFMKKGFHNFSVEYTEGPSHATEICQRAINDDYKIVAAVGGDGTINEVLNGLYKDDGTIDKNSALAFVSTGTGSDFSRMFNIVEDEEDRILSIMAGKREMLCDIVRADFVSWEGKNSSRCYINAADVGLGAETCVRINQGSKQMGGFISFLYAVLASLVKHKKFDLKLKIDEQDIFNGRTNELAVLNGRFYGGGMMMSPDAEIDDGLLDIVLLDDMKKSVLLKCLPTIYSGKHRYNPKVKMYRGEKIDIECSENIWVELDGETPGTSNISFEIMPAAIRLLY